MRGIRAPWYDGSRAPYVAFRAFGTHPRGAAAKRCVNETRGARPADHYPAGMATLVLTVLGDDRAGLVSAVSAALDAHGASWERSQLARLAGKFAGVVEVAAPDASVAALVPALEALAASGLTVVVERTDLPAEPGPEPAPPAGSRSTSSAPTDPASSRASPRCWPTATSAWSS